MNTNAQELLRTLIEDRKTQSGKVLLCDDDGTERLFDCYEDAIMFIILDQFLSCLEDRGIIH